jgi:hypothetical protein
MNYQQPSDHAPGPCKNLFKKERNPALHGFPPVVKIEQAPQANSFDRVAAINAAAMQRRHLLWLLSFEIEQYGSANQVSEEHAFGIAARLSRQYRRLGAIVLSPNHVRSSCPALSFPVFPNEIHQRCGRRGQRI